MSTLSLSAAAERMHIHENTMMKLIASGAIPAAKIGRAWVMLEADVMRYIEQQVIHQTAERMGTPMHKPRRRNGVGVCWCGRRKMERLKSAASGAGRLH